MACEITSCDEILMTENPSWVRLRFCQAAPSFNSSWSCHYCGWTKSISHHPRNPRMMTPPANTNKQWFPMVSKWCRILSIHSIMFISWFIVFFSSDQSFKTSGLRCLTELNLRIVFQNVFADVDSNNIIALCSCLVFDEKSEDPITNNLELMKAFETCKGIARNVAEVMAPTSAKSESNSLEGFVSPLFFLVLRF